MNIIRGAYIVFIEWDASSVIEDMLVRNWTLFLPSVTPHGVEFSENLCWAVIRMAPLLAPEEIQAYTTISLGRILLQWCETGEVKRRKNHHAYGRPRHLKLQEILRDSYGVDASAQAICRALKRSGFSMKKVSSSIFINRILNPPLNMVHTGSLLKHPLNEALSNQTCGVHEKDWLELTSCIFG